MVTRSTIMRTIAIHENNKKDNRNEDHNDILPVTGL